MLTVTFLNIQNSDADLFVLAAVVFHEGGGNENVMLAPRIFSRFLKNCTTGLDAYQQNIFFYLILESVKVKLNFLTILVTVPSARRANFMYWM